MAVLGKISGQMLKDNLLRNNVDLIIDGNLMYYDTNNRRVGINTITPGNALTVNGSVTASNLYIVNSNLTSLSGNLYLKTVSGNISASSLRITDVVDPVNNQDVATKYYVDNSVTSSVKGNLIALGANTVGALVSNAVTLTTTTTVTDGIAQLNSVLGKLVPPSPGTFPNSGSISLSGLSTIGRMTNFTQTDNSGWGNLSVAAGTTVSTGIRAATITTNTLSRQGPGDSGNVQVIVNGAATGYRVLTPGNNNNGTYGHLIISANQDYSVLSGGSAGFWSSFSAQASGANALPGWNQIYLTDSAGSNTAAVSWYYDVNNVGAPNYSNTNIALSTNSVTYSSTIPHLNNSSVYRLTGNVARLSGDVYYTSDTFITGTAGGAIAAPSSVTYSQAGVTTPLVRNAYVTSGSAYFTTTASVISGFGNSSTGPSMTVFNGYSSNTFTLSPGVNILYKTGTGAVMDESSLQFNSTVGTGSGLAFRIANPGSTDTPAYTGSESAFDSTNGPLLAYDATMVASVIKNDTINYSTGYNPVGPNLSSGRNSAQYYTFKFIRTSVSKFNVKYTGNIAGLYVALPGSTIDSTSSLNGWLDASIAYGGSGIPGATSPGNGTNGCAVGGPISPNSSVTNSNVTITFGTVSSSSTATNEIYVRLKLVTGQSVTLLQLGGATN